MKFIDELNSQKSRSQSKCKTVFDLKTLDNNLIFVKSYFLALLTTIKNVEKSNVFLVGLIDLTVNKFVKLRKLEKMEII